MLEIQRKFYAGRILKQYTNKNCRLDFKESYYDVQLTSYESQVTLLREVQVSAEHVFPNEKNMFKEFPHVSNLESF